MPSDSMHYLDYAATSAVRPQVVVDAVTEFLTTCGATPGRGGHRLSLEAGRMTLRCRRTLCEVLGLQGDPGRLAFTQNATQALNTALRGLLRSGDVVVVSPYAHNAVLRPVHTLAHERGVVVRQLSGTPEGTFDLDEVDRLLDGARLLVINAASNVLGTSAPVADLAGRAGAAGALVLVDAAQSAGHLTTRYDREGVDMVAVTGHKGLLGPQGTGALWLRPGVEIEPFLAGGTGGDSTVRDMPAAMPDRLEAGTQNAPGLAGLEAGARFVLERGIDQIHAREVGLKNRLREGLAAIPGVTVRSPRDDGGVGIVTVTSDRVDPGELSRRLDTEFGVLTRAGLHCSPEAHRLIGTLDTGAVRFSVGWASTEEDVEQALQAVDAIVRRPALAGT